MARAERYVKRMFMVIVILVIALIASVANNSINNKRWLEYIAMYDFESYELSTEGGGDANYIGNDGVIYYGEDRSETPSIEK